MADKRKSEGSAGNDAKKAKGDEFLGVFDRHATQELLPCPPRTRTPIHHRGSAPPSTLVMSTLAHQGTLTDVFAANLNAPPISDVVFRCANSLVEDILNGLDSDLPDEARAYVKKMCIYTCKGGCAGCFLLVGPPCEDPFHPIVKKKISCGPSHRDRVTWCNLASMLGPT
jgi:hypothetical protein